MTLGARLEQLRGATAVSEFASLFGIHKNTYSNYVKQQNVPDANFITAVCQRFGVSANWLLMGIGPKYLHDHPVDTRLEDVQPDSLHVFLPLIETWIIDREGELIHDGVLDYAAIKRSWIMPVNGGDFNEERLKSLLLTRVRRDFMSPTIKRGDLILVDTDRENRDRPTTGEVYLVRMPDGERAVKRVAAIERREGCSVFFYSDNVAYGPVEFRVPSIEDVHRFVMGRVRLLIREF